MCTYHLRVPRDSYSQPLINTSPRDMDGVPRLKQHDNLHRQMAAFEKLLQHAHSRFSKEKLYQMLHVLVRGIPKLPRHPHHARQEHTSNTVKITSVGQIKEIVQQLQNEKRKGIQREEETHLVRYFETFFRDLEYLRTLKKYFDERIYCCLYEYFYDPSVDDPSPDEITQTDQDQQVPDQNPPPAAPDPTSARTQKSHNHLSTGTQPSTALTPSKSPIFALTEMQRLQEAEEGGGVRASLSLGHLTSVGKLATAVRDLYELNERWDFLLCDNELSLLYYDPDSYYELIQFSDQASFELVFRLIPDLFVKAYKAIALAKLWWTNANKVYSSGPGRRHSGMRSYRQRMSELQDSIGRLAADMERDEVQLSTHRADLRALTVRENRFTVLNENCEKVEEMKNSVGIKYNEILKQRETLLQKRETTLKSTSHFQDIEKRIRRVNMEVLEMYDKLRILTFQFDILEQDLKVELEMRPDIIRFIDHVSEKIHVLDNSLKTKRSMKHVHEKQLVLLRTNHEKMREIMRRHLPSEDSKRMEYELNPNLTIIEHSGALGESVWKDRVSADRRRSIHQVTRSSSDETGNEADTESPIPQRGLPEPRDNEPTNRSEINDGTTHYGHRDVKDVNSAANGAADDHDKLHIKPTRVPTREKALDQKHSKSKIPRHTMFRQP